MGFEKFGIVSHTKESKAENFVTSLEQGKVMGTKCKKCDTNYFPPQADCPGCVTSDMEWFEIKGKGKLISYSVVNYGPIGFEDKAPYTLALSEFEEGIKVFANISSDIKEDEIEIGMSLKVVPINLPDDKVSFEFQIAEDA